MTKVKIGGVILTGFAAYLLLGRVMNLAERSVKDICEAAKWRAYYKAKPEDPIPPGYSRTRQDGYEEDPTGADHSKDNEKQASAAAKNEALKDVIIQGVNGVLDAVKDRVKPNEGQSEASEEGYSEEAETETNDTADDPAEALQGGDPDGDEDIPEIPVIMPIAPSTKKRSKEP